MDERRLPGRSGRRLFNETEAARRFQRRLREVRPPSGVRPAFVYDESGYPIERQTSLADRVRRLITG
jgi:hypothetical protein